MTVPTPLTATALAAFASQILDEAGYHRIRAQRSDPALRTVRLYEDAYGVVAVVVYETWVELAASWPDVQGELVDLMSSHLERHDAKAHEGYLVLLTPSVIPADARSESMAIERDTTYVRKLLGTGEVVRSLADARRVLLPLLPLEPLTELVELRSALDLLPGILDRRGIPEEAVRVAIRAFIERENPLEELFRAGPFERADLA